ncbi:hypothetical protein CWB41_05345 [Methylovirgula ligni]|uniref:DoxX-like protein n=2 Tax=Methylovirgula ligni TaxID=569860 RepID=A0A3D9Z7G2_9HYPH|nr:hypothetical protein CWB41_05345 [Methylovirgula ligni]REF89479.1 DoxX-like protein [Methylovirgula ligni]
MPTSRAPLRPNIESGDRTMPVIKFITVGLPIALGVVMIGTGGLNFAGPPLARENFALWGYPAGFHRVAGSLGVVIGLLLVIPATSRVGAIASAIFMLAAVATLIRSRDWGHLPVAAVLMAVSAAAIAIHG